MFYERKQHPDAMQFHSTPFTIYITFFYTVLVYRLETDLKTLYLCICCAYVSLNFSLNLIWQVMSRYFHHVMLMQQK